MESTNPDEADTIRGNIASLRPKSEDIVAAKAAEGLRKWNKVGKRNKYTEGRLKRGFVLDVGLLVPQPNDI